MYSRESNLLLKYERGRMGLSPSLMTWESETQTKKIPLTLTLFFFYFYEISLTFIFYKFAILFLKEKEITNLQFIIYYFSNHIIISHERKSKWVVFVGIELDSLSLNHSHTLSILTNLHAGTHLCDLREWGWWKKEEEKLQLYLKIYIYGGS